MDSNLHETPAVLTPPPPPPGLFGTKIPSGVTFAVAILLFLLPFAEVKCGNTALVHKSGLDIAFHNDWKRSSGFFNKDDFDTKNSSREKEKEGNSQLFAIIALGLGVVGLLLAFGNAKTAGTGGTVAGGLSAIALIGLMIDMKKWFNDSIAKDLTDRTREGTGDSGLDKMGDYLNNVKPTLNFTPWFYVAIAAFLVAAFFCYKRMSAVK